MLKTRIIAFNDLIRFTWIKRNCSYSMKTLRLNPFRKKTKPKKPKINKQHPVIKYMAEMQDLEINIYKTSELKSESESLIHAIETNKSQILGFDLSEYKRRVQLFHGLGSSLSDAITLSLSIPSIFHVNNTNFKSIIKTMRQYKLSVEKIIYNYPYVGVFNSRQFESNIKLLYNHVPNGELDSLILNNPSLMMFQLDKSSLTTLVKSSFKSDDNLSKLQNIKAVLNEPSVDNQELKNLLSNKDDFESSIDPKVVDLLSSYDIIWKNLYRDCPEFLATPHHEIEKCLDSITSSPFYFEVEDVEQLLKSRPDIFLLFNQSDTLEMVDYLEKIFKQKGHLFRLLNEDPEILRDPGTFFRRVEIFKKFGLKDHDIALLIAQPGGQNCFTDCEEFTDSAIEDILSFYTQGKDLVNSQIVFSAPASLSPKFSSLVKNRINYLRSISKMNTIAKNRKRKKSHVTIQSIIKCKEDHFVNNICGTSQEEYYKFLNKS